MTKRTPHEATPELIERVILLRSQGKSFGQIAEIVDISKRTVMNIVADHTNQIRPYFPNGVSAEEFIRVWQINSSVEAVSQQLGLKMSAVLSRAYNYRQQGVQLKRYPRGVARGYDWDDLAEFALLFEEDDSDNPQ